MMVFLSDFIGGLLILLVTLILNGDAGNPKMPFYALAKHQRFIQKPYMLLYFYVATSFVGQIPNSIHGFWLFLSLVLMQTGIIVFIITQLYHKNLLDWSLHLSRIKQIFVKIMDKQSAEKDSSLTLQDIMYFLQNVVFPSLFVFSNAYLIVKLMLILKQL